MSHTQACEGAADELLRERHEEAQRDAEAYPMTMSREQFDARLKELHERTLLGQARRRAASEQREERRAA